MWKVHDASEMEVLCNLKSNFPISLSLTFGNRPGTPLYFKNSCGAWFEVDEAEKLIANLQKAVLEAKDHALINHCAECGALTDAVELDRQGGLCSNCPHPVVEGAP